ncbi:alpha/beta hydrolase [Sphingorhabdus sp. Alg239-R122]|uniref:alpha/beta fold hydrolase n=1 Tax=Sphingorhabdus sp. Alg239-R122 TaxID=2305989 RepID=UPI0013DC6CCD|nr:alpha/beta hydrolase [Sphingorhabdus sp. Alg239-R122]
MSASSEAIYFCHGVPGSPHDVRIMQNSHPDIPVLAPNMLQAGTGNPIMDTLENFVQATSELPDGHIHLIGFSIGAMAAIKIAAMRSESIGRLTLISPAAPLSLGNFLPYMAGKPVFMLASKWPAALKCLTFGQGIALRFMPEFLIKQLFAKCGEAEKELLDKPEYREAVIHGLSNSFHTKPSSYIRFIQSYVEDWSTDLENITCPVEIWHGSKDTWAPVTMSEKLCDMIAVRPKLNIVEDAEHYSTLAQFSITPMGLTGEKK